MKAVLSKYVSRYKHFLALLYYLIAGRWFSYCERTVKPKYYMFSRLDNYIPFIKEFVIPYLFWFMYIAIALIYLGLFSREDFYRLCIFMFGGMTVCYTVYLLFPNGQNLRPDVTGDDIFSKLVALVYANDTPTNVCPSIHVFNSIAVHISLIKSHLMQDKKWLKNISMVCMLLICASTVFIKQHSIIDVMWACVLALVFYVIVYIVPNFEYGNASVSEKEIIS